MINIVTMDPLCQDDDRAMSFSVLAEVLVEWYPNGAAFNATVDGVVQMMCFDAFCVGVLVAWRPRSVFVYGIRRGEYFLRSRRFSQQWKSETEKAGTCCQAIFGLYHVDVINVHLPPLRPS